SVALADSVKKINNKEEVSRKYINAKCALILKWLFFKLLSFIGIVYFPTYKIIKESDIINNNI
ncbi:hypothetical protein, partial [Enterobacter hormaechei]|uniref:hypothetical protein n=1 Tax=Enterobacter hormaechei TaxID=158836 RepID=UPI001C3E9516